MYSTTFELNNRVIFDYSEKILQFNEIRKERFNSNKFVKTFKVLKSEEK